MKDTFCALKSWWKMPKIVQNTWHFPWQSLTDKVAWKFSKVAENSTTVSGYQSCEDFFYDEMLYIIIDNMLFTHRASEHIGASWTEGEKWKVENFQF